MAYTEGGINKKYLGQSELMASNARKSNSKLRPDGYIYILKLKCC